MKILRSIEIHEEEGGMARYGVPIVDCIVLNAGVPLSESFAKMEK